MGGTTGSGKSEFLKSLLLSLLVRYNPQHLKIVLVDPKRVTFPEFEQMPWLLAPVIKDGETAIAIMQQLVDEMTTRYHQFEHQQCNDLPSYNQRLRDRPEKQLPRIVCIFDEYADFMVEKEIANALEQSIKRLGAMARAAGIHLIIATQRPEAKVVTPLIRSNLPGPSHYEPQVPLILPLSWVIKYLMQLICSAKAICSISVVVSKCGCKAFSLESSSCRVPTTTNQPIPLP